MYPILFSIGPVHIFSMSVFLILSWLLFSFLFWKFLRANGVEEDKIFDMTFYATLVAFICARVVFVLLHWELFADTWLKIVALWVQPGLSLTGGLVGGVMTMISMSRNIKVRLGYVLDAMAIATPAALLVGLIGGFLDGSEVGKIVDVPFAVRYIGYVGKRHPVQVYEFIAVLIIFIIILVLQRKGAKKKWPFGLLGIWFFILYSLVTFGIEFAKESHVYLKSLSANQWVAIAIFAESMGVLYVRGGGRDALRPFFNSITGFFTKIRGGIYAKFSKRRTE